MSAAKGDAAADWARSLVRLATSSEATDRGRFECEEDESDNDASQSMGSSARDGGSDELGVW